MTQRCAIALAIGAVACSPCDPGRAPPSGEPSPSADLGLPAVGDPPLPGVDAIDRSLAHRLEQASALEPRRASPAHATRTPVNRLVLEASPLLRARGRDPVNWHPWTNETVARAEREGRPIAAWVARATDPAFAHLTEQAFAHEGFAASVNSRFVPVLVDAIAEPATAGWLEAEARARGEPASGVLLVVLSPDGAVLATWSAVESPLASVPRPTMQDTLRLAFERWRADPRGSPEARSARTDDLHPAQTRALPADGSVLHERLLFDDMRHATACTVAETADDAARLEACLGARLAPWIASDGSAILDASQLGQLTRDGWVAVRREPRRSTAALGAAASAFAALAVQRGRADDLARAQAAGHTLLAELRRNDGSLLALAPEGGEGHEATATGYAWTLRALLSLFEADGERRWLEEAVRVDRALATRFENGAGALFDRSGAEPAVALVPRRRVTPEDEGATLAVAALNRTRLGALTGSDALRESAARLVASAPDPGPLRPLLSAAVRAAGAPPPLVLVVTPVPDGADPLAGAVRRLGLRAGAIAVVPTVHVPRFQALIPALAGKGTRWGRTTAYVCGREGSSAALTTFEAVTTALASASNRGGTTEGARHGGDPSPRGPSP